MTSARPVPSVLRAMSDEAVLRALMDAPRLTRAELAVTTGLSKPTAAESIRRLETLGLVHDTGERTSGRGGVGSYYALTDDVGVALAVSIAPAGIAVERVEPAGDVTVRHVERVGRPASTKTVARLLRTATRGALAGIVPAAARVVVISAADPVDRLSGSLVHLPDAPFLLGDLSPARILGPLVNGPVLVDNDVNWAARAEHAARAAGADPGPDDFVYLHLGEGLGCAVVADGEVRRGHSGLAGEIAHLITTGPDGRATAFTTVFDQLGVRHAGSTAIDVDTLLGRIAESDGAQVMSVVATAVCDVITAAIGLLDPQLVVIGGEWGAAPMVHEAVQNRLRDLSRSTPVDLPRVAGDSALAGARSAALAELRADAIRRSRREHVT